MVSGGLRIAMVLRSSREYGTDYVDRICRALDESAPGIPRVCLSDVEVRGCERIPLQHKWPRWWAKMELFRPDVEGDLLYMDLDTIPTGDLSPLVSACNGHPIMLRDFYHKERVGSGLMYLPSGVRAQVWDKWRRNPEAAMRKYFGGTKERWGDQAFLADHMEAEPLRWQDITPGAVVSYKADVRKSGAVPAGARIVCFHGQPRPRDVGWRLPGIGANGSRPAPQAPPTAKAADIERWRGATVFLVGGGPSAADVDLESLRGRGLVVAINDAATRLPWADVMFTADMSYVARRIRVIHDFAGTKILAAPADFRLPNGVGVVERVTRKASGATSDDPMVTVTGNSGFSALVLAAVRGAERVVLIGFDMAGPGHWFGEYEWQCRLGVENYPDWIAQMEAVADWIAAQGCDVVNVNPASAIRSFRFAALEDVIR